MRMENSPEYEAEMNTRLDEMRKRREANERIIEGCRSHCWAGGVPWQPIESCPFAALADTYGYEGVVLFTDGENIARASVRERFGRPLIWSGEGHPEYVMRDGMMVLDGDGEFVEPDRPEWWFEWELTDEDGFMTYAGGEETGKEEIDFVPTRWLLLPLPSPDTEE